MYMITHIIVKKLYNMVFYHASACVTVIFQIFNATFSSIFCVRRGLRWLSSQEECLRDMKCSVHHLEVMGSNSGRVEFGMCSMSAKVLLGRNIPFTAARKVFILTCTNLNFDAICAILIASIISL